MARKIKVYPCCVFILGDDNVGYKEGYRLRVDDIDGDRWYFADKDRMHEMLSIHAMHPITVERMDKIRERRARRQEKKK
jgi:hypothetical protein